MADSVLIPLWYPASTTSGDFPGGGAYGPNLSATSGTIPIVGQDMRRFAGRMLLLTTNLCSVTGLTIAGGEQPLTCTKQLRVLDGITRQDLTAQFPMTFVADQNTYIWELPPNVPYIRVSCNTPTAGNLFAVLYGIENPSSDLGQPRVYAETAGPGGPGQNLKTFTSPAGGVALTAGNVTVKLNANATDWIVTTGFTGYVTDLSITGSFATAVNFQLLAGATVIMDGWAKGDTGPISLAGIETQPTATSGQTVSLKFVTTATGNVSWYVGAYEWK